MPKLYPFKGLGASGKMLKFTFQTYSGILGIRNFSGNNYDMLEFLRKEVRSLEPPDEKRVRIPLSLEPHESALASQDLWEISVHCLPARVFDETDPLNPVIKHPPSD